MPRIKNHHHRRTLLLLSLSAVAGILSITACSSEENPAVGSVSVAVVPTSINVAPGGTGNAAATVTRGGSFTGAVTLSSTGAPTGITVTFSPASVPGASTASTVNVAVGAAVAAGSHAITISAAGSGVTTATTTLTVVVVAGDAGSIALAATPTTLNVAAGAAAVTSDIAITRTAPFAGAVGFTVSGAPAGVTASMNPVSAPGAASTLSVSATASAVNGTYPLVVRGSGTGIADATVTVNATVTGGAAAGASFTFSPTPLPVTAGGAANTSSVTIARQGTFAPNGALNLVLSGAPAGLTASVAPSTNVTGATATVTAQASAAVPAGTYNLTLTGTGTGIPNATATLPVLVSGVGGGSVSVTFCAEDAPIWVASQDGSGAWTRVNPTSGTTYQFNFGSGKGGVATVDTVGAGTDLSVIYATVAEFTTGASTTNNGGCETNKSVNGSVSGVGATELASVSLGSSAAVVIPAVSTSFELNDVPAGLQDLVATRTDGTTSTVNWVILRRALNPANGSTLPVLAFGTEGFAPASANVTVTGLGSDAAAVASLFTGVRGSSFAFLSSITDIVAATPPQPFAAIPAGNLQANELQELIAFAEEQGNSNSDRSAGLYFTTVSNRTVALGPKLSTPTVTKIVTAPNARPNVLLVSQSQYNRLFSAEYEQSSLNRTANVVATTGYYGSLPGTWNVTLPDLAGAAGWDTNWGLADGTPIDWTVSAQGGAIQFLDVNIADGSATQSASIQSATPLALRGLHSSDDAFAMQRRLLEVLGGRNRSPLH